MAQTCNKFKFSLREVMCQAVYTIKNRKQCEGCFYY